MPNHELIPRTAKKSPKSQTNRVITAGLSWREDSRKTNWTQWLGLKKKTDFMLDLMALLLDENGKISNKGRLVHYGGGNLLGPVGGDLVYYGNQDHVSRAVWHGAGMAPLGASGDCEQIFVDLETLPEYVEEVIFIASVRHAVAGKQNLGWARGAKFSLKDAADQEIGSWTLMPTVSEQSRCVEILKLKKSESNWKIIPVMKGHEIMEFPGLLTQYA